MTKSLRLWLVLFLVFSALVLPALSRADGLATAYQLTGTLLGPVDPMNLNGDSFGMTLIAQTFLGAFPDPNGTQYGYQGTGTLMIGGTSIPISGTTAYFFHSGSGQDDVANFFLYPASGTPSFYYPAVNLPPDANASAGSAPPVYPSDIALAAYFLVPENGQNYVFQVTSESFSSTPVPEPPSVLLLVGGLVGLFVLVSRRSRWPGLG